MHLVLSDLQTDQILVYLSKLLNQHGKRYCSYFSILTSPVEHKTGKNMNLPFKKTMKS